MILEMVDKSRETVGFHLTCPYLEMRSTGRRKIFLLQMCRDNTGYLIPVSPCKDCVACTIIFIVEVFCVYVNMRTSFLDPHT